MNRLVQLVGRIRVVLALVTALLGVSLLLPLWRTRMEAPQYKGEEALWVRVYVGRVVGDLKEIDTINEYVGVHLPLEGVEMRLVPWAFGVLLLLSVVATLLPRRLQRRGAASLLAALMTVAVCSMGLLQYRLWQMGHERGEQILEGVDDFTPPVVGSIHIANFDATMSLGAGGWALVLAASLCAGLLVAGRAGRKGESPPVTNSGAASKIEAASSECAT